MFDWQTNKFFHKILHTLHVIISSGGRIQDFAQGGGLNLFVKLFRGVEFWRQALLQGGGVVQGGRFDFSVKVYPGGTNYDA